VIVVQPLLPLYQSGSGAGSEGAFSIINALHLTAIPMSLHSGR